MAGNNRNKKYTHIPRDRRNNAFGRCIFTLAIICIVLMLFIKFAYPMIVAKTKKAAADKAVEIMYDNIDKLAGDNEKAKEMLESISEEDKEKVSEILAEHMDAETVSEVAGYVNNNDQQGLLEYATENLSPEEMEQFKDLYEKYSE